MATPSSSSYKGSVRVKEQRRFMDEASRQRRARKKLESLEQDNFHDDPHADLVMSKKALSLFQDDGTDNLTGAVAVKSRDKNRRKSRNAEYYKQRYGNTFLSFKKNYFGTYLLHFHDIIIEIHLWLQKCFLTPLMNIIVDLIKKDFKYNMKPFVSFLL